jgi:excisionase family DNA binding protein
VPEKTPRIITPNEAAELVGAHPNTIRRWCADGYIRAWRVGPRKWRIDLDALEAQLLGAE